MAKRERRPRVCDRCGKPYLRRNLSEEWDTRNPGHRDGWGKTIVRVCMDCRSIRESQRIIVLVGTKPKKEAS